MKYYIIAGEASGDLHASNLMKEIKKLDNSADFRCWGGDKMEEQGAHLVKHYRDLDFMGFIEVIFNLRTILNNIKLCKSDILEYKPDTLVLVDYPGFNMRIAEFAKENNIRVVYYISPQIWAWKQGRIKKIKKSVDRMMTILPFEKDFYAKFDYDVDFVGHPLLDAFEGLDLPSEEEFRKDNDLSDKPLIALLPGSRKQEIQRMLPVMTNIMDDFPEYQFVIAATKNIEPEFYKQFLSSNKITFVTNKTYDLLNHSNAAVVTSGTATLETALLDVPQVCCYKANKVSYQIAKRLVKIKYISLVNLIMDQEVIKELIQNDMNEELVKAELTEITKNPQKVEHLKKDYVELRQMLGGTGASANAAKIVTNGKT